MPLKITCPCCSGNPYEECCESFHSGKKDVPTAEKLMRSRFSAFAIPNGAYLLETTIPENRPLHCQQELQHWGAINSWTKLEIINSSLNQVDFNAFYRDKDGAFQIHHELSTFQKVAEKWYYVSGEFLD